MKNPWEDISLADYENHMKHDSVMQLQTMNEMMKGQFYAYHVSNVMILGIAGGNGLEHIQKDKFKKVYGVDINSSYLKEVSKRYPELDGLLDCLCINLNEGAEKLPNADLVIANLLVEYVGYECIQNVIKHVNPKYVSCIIQVNMEDDWVSASPYLHVFDRLEQVHYQINECALKKAMSEVNYCAVKSLERMLPNRKKLVQVDFEKQPSLVK